MIDVSKAYSEFQRDTQSVHEWVDSIYESSFKASFQPVYDIYERMKSTSSPITDAELQWILIDLPMELFQIAEKLNRLKLESELLQLKLKEQVQELRSEISKDNPKLTKTEQNERISSMLISEYSLGSAYSTLISRVEKEISYSKELIMGAKKIWDGRRQGEAVNPIGEVNVPPDQSSDDDLPMYIP